ncbi:MAG: SRPBCC domain-containing protein [Gemmatimonadaceae bacterium]
MLAPIVRVVEVPCSQQMAFNIFIEDMPRWWPLDRFSMSRQRKQTAQGLKIDARLGGHIAEITEDGTEDVWGTFSAFNPFASLAMDFHMGMPASNASLVEVTFDVIAEKSTRVTLRHSRWEAFGDMAEMMISGYNTGWTQIFEKAYAAACVAKS